MSEANNTGIEYANQVAANDLTARLAAAEADRDEAEAAKVAAWESAARWKSWKDAAEANLAKATAVIEECEWHVHFGADGQCPICRALSNYHAGPAETETPGGADDA